MLILKWLTFHFHVVVKHLYFTYFLLIVSLPSLNFIAWRDNAGNSRMEPKLLYGCKLAKRNIDSNIYLSGKDELREIIGAVTMWPILKQYGIWLYLSTKQSNTLRSLNVEGFLIKKSLRKMNIGWTRPIMYFYHWRNPCKKVNNQARNSRVLLLSFRNVLIRTFRQSHSWSSEISFLHCRWSYAHKVLLPF